MTEKLRSVKDKSKKISGSVINFFKAHKIVSALIIMIVIILIISVIGTFASRNNKRGASAEITAQRRDIEESISDSTVVEPNSEYSVTANVSGDIIEDYFEEGDWVNKDDLMYKIDTKTIENNIKSADIAIERAKQSYDDAVAENKLTVRDTETGKSSVESARLALEKAQQAYNDALRAADDLSITSNYSGYITEIHVSEGDTVAAGSPVAEVVDNSSLIIRVPFNTADTANISSGESAILTLTKNGSTLNGTVTEVNPRSEGGDGFTLYNYVKIEVQNPGAVKSGDTATAIVGNIACGDAGTFENITEETITAPISGKITEVYITENQYVARGGLVAKFDSDSADSQITSARLSVEDAKQALERARIQSKTSEANTALGDEKLGSAVENAKLAYDDAILSKDNLLKQLDDYTIKAPISGTVVTKNKKKGDSTMGAGSSESSYSSASSASMSAGNSSAAALSSGTSSSAMAVIYDMSKLKCTLNVDEIDINNVRAGQRVAITTDVSDKEYNGIVETVSVNGSAGQNGVTTYPVKINIIDFDDKLLPGMNIEAKIVLSSVKDVLSIPVSSLNRGNIVYVKGEKTDQNDAAPEGYHSVSVVTGASDDEYIQVLSGLNEGDVLYAAEYDPMQDMMDMMEDSRDSMRSNMTGGGGE